MTPTSPSDLAPRPAKTDPTFASEGVGYLHGHPEVAYRQFLAFLKRFGGDRD